MFVWSKLSSAKWADAWEERFSGNPAHNLVITSVPGRQTVRVEVYVQKKPEALLIQKNWGGSVREIKQTNWAALSREPMPDIPIRDRLVICSAKSAKEISRVKKRYPQREVIAIPAEMAFGTGHHATTASVLRMMVDQLPKTQAWTMADLGCGSGILAIAAKKLGAAHCWGCDFDKKAVEVAKENAQINGTPNVRFARADVTQWEPKEAYDLVAANIFVDVLEAAFPAIVKSVKPGGLLFVSGILKDQAGPCLRVAEKQGIQWQKTIVKGKWLSAFGRRKRSEKAR